MHLKGIILSIDALLALAFAALILSLPLVLSHNSTDFMHFQELGLLGRDYLTLKHGPQAKNLTPTNFTELTGHPLVESEPSDLTNYWIPALYYKYPNYFNCTNSTSCSFANTSAQANYSNAQDTGLPHKYQAWVRP